MVRRSLVLALLSLTAACSSDSKSGGTQPLPAPRRVVTADWLNNSLSVLDYDALVGGATTRDEALVDTIALGTYEPGPLEVVATPDGKRVVATVGPGFFAGAIGAAFGVTNIATTGTALIVDLETKDVVEVPPPSPCMGLAVTPNGAFAFTANFNGTTMSVIDLATDTVKESIELGRGPEEISLAPDGTVGAINIDSLESVVFFDPSSPATTLSPPLLVGADPGGSCFVPSVNRLVIGQSLVLAPTQAVPGFSVIDVTDPQAPILLENQSLGGGIPYGADWIPGTTHVLLTAGVGAGPTGCALHEFDVSTMPATRVRTIELPCTPGTVGFPMSTAVEPEGKFAFTGVMSDNSLMVVDLDTGTVTRIPWLSDIGPTDVTLVLPP